MLGERAEMELVYGQVGKPWKGAGSVPNHPVTPFGATAWVLTAESRVALTDEDTRRRFRRYWLAAGPFIRLMRPAIMRALARQFPEY